MRRAYGVRAVRAAEQALMASLPEGALMQRAAAGLAAACVSLLEHGPGLVYGARVCVLAGSGDNGGDALYAGARLARRGAAVTAVLAAPRAHAGGMEALLSTGARAVSAQDGPADLVRAAVAGADLVIDGLLGIGGKGGLREPFAALAAFTQTARQAGAVVVAVDLPSGVDADTGEVGGPAISADATITFGALKPGLLIDPGATRAGAVHLVDIGLGPYLDGPPAACAAQLEDIRAALPRPTAESDKYRRGVLGLLAGSDQFTGAAVLAAGGAVHGGAGMIRVVTGPEPARLVRQAWPETVVTEYPEHAEAGQDPLGSPGRVQAWVAGPGMGTSAAAGRRLAAVLASDVPVLVDADGLTLLARSMRGGGHRSRSAPTLITPHAGELGRLLDASPADIEARRLEHARRAAAELGVTVLLKGSTTVIASPGDEAPVQVNPTGTAWLATAGSGDVLAGLAGALLAQGLPAAVAAAAAAFLHGLAGRLAAGETDDAAAPIGATDLVRALPAAFRAVAGSIPATSGPTTWLSH